jgi:hypothetical protein
MPRRLIQKGEVLNPKGRLPGTKNQHSLRQAAEAAKKYGILPLDFFLTNLNDPKAKFAVKMDCAKAAAPYVHRKMPIAIDNGEGGPVSFATPEQLARLPAKDLKVLQEIMSKVALLAKSDPAIGISAAVAEQTKEDE